MRKWVEILVPSLIALICIAGVGYGRLLLVERQATENRADIEKMQESWLSAEDVKELKTDIRALSGSINTLKSELPPQWFQDRVAKLEDWILELEKRRQEISPQ